MKNGNAMRTGYTPGALRRNLSEGPSWIWDNPGDELRRASPLIDDEMNIYLSTGDGWVRKFNPDGQILWTWRTTVEEGKLNCVGAIYAGSMFVYSDKGFVFSLSMATGALQWRTLISPIGFTFPETGTVFAYNDTILCATKHDWPTGEFDGNNVVKALNATNGRFRWEFKVDVPFWNFVASTPGDGTVLWANFAGHAYRVDLSDGRQIWMNGFLDQLSFCTSGGVLGPNGVFYVESNHGGGLPGGPGVIHAYRVSDGVRLWHQIFGRHQGMQVPAVGPIGPSGELAVVAAVGENPALSWMLLEPTWMPFSTKAAILRAQLRYPWLRRLFGIPVLVNAVVALKADTGRQLWRWDQEPYDQRAGWGDEIGMERRILEADQDPVRREVLCGPDNAATPTIAGDGHVYVGSGQNGNLYKIKDVDGNGFITENEVEVFDAGSCFLNAPALAPGMLAVAPCWGPMYVFRDSV